MELPTLFRSLRPRRRLRPRLISLPLYHGRPCGKRIHNRGRRRKQSSLPFARQRAKAISPQTPAAGFPTLGSEPPTSSSNGRDARYHSLSVADEAVRTQRGLEESSAKTIRCKKRLRLIQRDIAEAESTNRKDGAAAVAAQEGLQRENRTAASGATATPSPPTRQQSVYAVVTRPGEDTVSHISVVCMASTPRQEFRPELGGPIAEKATALLHLGRRTSLHGAELLTVAKAWSDMDSSSYLRQTKAAPPLALVFAL